MVSRPCTVHSTRVWGLGSASPLCDVMISRRVKFAQNGSTGNVHGNELHFHGVENHVDGGVVHAVALFTEPLWT